MRSDLETTRAVRSWLEDGRTRLPDSVLDAVLDQLPATHQRRSSRPARRIADMNLAAKGLLAAAAVLVFAVVGLNLLPGLGIGPGPAAVPTPTVTPTPAPTPTPTVTPTPALLLGWGDLPVGPRRLVEGEFTRLPFTITLPFGWRRDATDGNAVYKGASKASDAFDNDGVLFVAWIISHVYRESCDWDGTLQAVSTTDEVVQALAAQTGHETGGPTATTLGGRPATRFEFSLPADFDPSSCDSNLVRLWPDAGPIETFGLPMRPGQATTVYVVDIDGQAQLIAAIRNGASAPADVAELDAIVSSLQFDE